MEELFDGFNSGGTSGGSGFSTGYHPEEETIVENPDQIIAELCGLTNLPSEEPTSLKLQDPPDIEEILSLDETLIPATSHNVGVINAACQQVLKEMEQHLLALLKQNRKEQEIVQNFLSTNGKITVNEKKANLKCAGMPYFKDLDGYPPPQNEDVLKKRKEGKLVPIDIIENSPIWNSNHAKALVKAVKNNSADLQSIDWMKISATDMEGKFSPSECKSKWLMNLSPNINRSKWTTKEIKQLEVLVGKHNHQDWDTIAVELNTNRTCLQCCVQYHAHKTGTEGKWTKDEDDTLKMLIERYRIKDFIPWGKVAWHFERRSLRQCQERYAYHLVGIKKGNFTMEEDFVLTYLAMQLKNFGEVAKFLPKRVSPQIRARYEYLVQVSMPSFTKEEDKLLSELMIKYPRNWSKISEFFKDRSKLQCRRRWAYLQRGIKVDLNESDTEEMETINGGSQKKTKKDKRDVENVVNKLQYVSRPGQCNKRYAEEYAKLINYHKHCHKFLFGPKPKMPSSTEECQQLCKKMSVVMKYLSVGREAPLSSFDVNSLLNNCEFGGDDIAVLNAFPRLDEMKEGVEISGKIIPPNYMTLVGLRTLFLSWEMTRGLCGFYKPPQVRPDIGERILGGDAKKLFKARMKALFAFPLVLSNISQEGMQTKRVSKPKSRKASKPLSKRRRKEHSKLMSQAYREKLQKKLKEEGLGGGDEVVVDLQPEPSSGRKRQRRSTTTSDPPVKKPRQSRTRQ